MKTFGRFRTSFSLQGGKSASSANVLMSRIKIFLPLQICKSASILCTDTMERS